MRFIDASKVINEIERFKGYLDEDMIWRIKFAINRLPTIEIEIEEKEAESITIFVSGVTTEVEFAPVRHGRWMHNGFMEVKCNNCGNVFHELEDTNYCPSCGCKMDLDEVNK